MSNEPGFYASEEFGIRIENLLTVQPIEIAGQMSTRKFLKFSPLTLVPIQVAGLVDMSIMSPAELDWIDAYHARVWETISEHVSAESGARDWLRKMTAPVQRQ